jgi:hypothetical protein
LRALSQTRTLSPAKHSNYGKKWNNASTKKSGKAVDRKKVSSRSKSRSGVKLSNQAEPMQYRKKLPAGQNAPEPAKKTKSPVLKNGQDEKPRTAKPKKDKKVNAAAQPMPMPMPMPMPVVLSSMPPPPVAAVPIVEPLVVIPLEDFQKLAEESTQK